MGEGDGDQKLAAEARARVLIDQQLDQAGWKVQDKKDLNLFAGPGIAVREAVMKPGHGRVDYLLYVDQAVVGVIEAKPVGTPLSGVEWQSAMYAAGLPVEASIDTEYTDGELRWNEYGLRRSQYLRKRRKIGETFDHWLRSALKGGSLRKVDFLTYGQIGEEDDGEHFFYLIAERRIVY